MKDLSDTAEFLQARIRDTLTVGDVILAVGDVSFRGKESGVETQALFGYFIQVRDGRLLNLRVFRDPEEAFKVLA